MSERVVTVTLPEMRVSVRLGWSAEERVFPQIVLVSVVAELMLREVFATERLEDTEDYVSLVQEVHSFLEAQEFRLVEKLLFDLEGYLFLQFPLLHRVTVTVVKTVIPQVAGVSFSLTQSR